MRLCTTVAVLAFLVVFPLQLECTTCHVGDQTDFADGDCPVKLSSTTPSLRAGEEYSEFVTVKVLKEAWDKNKAPKIEIITPWIDQVLPKKCKNYCSKKLNKHGCGVGVRQQLPQGSSPFSQWKQVYCIKANAGVIVSVMYSSSSRSCTVNCTVSDPIPNFNLSVNQSSKSFIITVDPGQKVKARWCYLKNSGGCISRNAPVITIDPSRSLSAPLNFPLLLPCVCVEGYYTHVDARRHRSCPFLHERLKDVSDVWLSSSHTLFKSHLEWSSECPASYLQISGSLCWRQHEHVCTPVLNLTLLESNDGNLKYNISTVDKHPQMCVQLSLEGSYNLSCPFQSSESSWEVNIKPGKQSVLLNFTSALQAKFSAQLCVLNERGCTPVGQVHFAAMEENSTETRIHVPLHSLVVKRPCVQVWQSNPALSGRRILCPDYTHNRWGLCASAPLIAVALILMLGLLIYRLTKKGAAGWLSIQKPVLLICSSEQADHVSAVCALASILQGELSATVQMALWAQNSQTQAGAATVADLGPLPWLYGQWEAVRKAQGKVLIVWSPEANRTHDTWREEWTTQRQERQLNGKRLEPCKAEKALRENEKQCDDMDFYPQKEPSTVIAPVFTAALACLEGALQECKGQGVALVYFQGLCRHKDIPKAFRGVPRYCLPQEFRGFIQELGGIRRQTKTDKLRQHCWTRLLSKVLSVWLAQQLAQRLQTLLLKTQGKNIQGWSVPLALKKKSDKTQTRLKLPRAASTAKPGTMHEHEPLHVSPWRVETL